ncbi:MAG: hypothetical protein DHS20C16_33950 [Phycisphaerae bacterium]|nr:MAG: hypothetical protein DHS20C16_33950 [Phycisphaerae bacterium]
MLRRHERHFVKTVGCIGLMLFTSMHVPSCTPPPVDNGGGDGGDNGGEELVLSSENLKIGEILTIRHDSIVDGEIRIVSFRQDDGIVQEHEAIAHMDGALSVLVPPYFDAEGDAITAGRFGISIDGVNVAGELFADDLYELNGVETGAVITMFINSTLNDIDANLARLDADDGFDTDVEDEALRAALLENRDYYQALLNEWETSQTLTFETTDSETVIVQADQVREAERYLANVIVGAHNEIQRRNGAETSRIIGGNCIGQSDIDVEACLQQCIQDVKDDAVRAAQTAGIIPTVAAGVITIGGIFLLSEGVILLGVVVTTVGVTTGLFTAYAANQNTDTFGQNDGEGFSASREVISQLTRFGANIVNAPASLALGAKDLASALEAAKCGDDDPNQRVRIDAEDIQFCEIVLDDFVQNVNTNITGLGGGSASSRFSADFPVAAALDADSFSSWFSDGGTDEDNSEVYTWQLVQDTEYIISRVEVDPEQFEGGGKFGFAGGTLRILDASGGVAFSQDYGFAASRVEIDQAIPEGTRGRSVQLILNVHQDQSCGGFAELRVFGRQP